MTAKPIMVQGTMSGAGKSLVVAGLCRIFKQDGWRVAPFKSQNMALNSFITKEGLEMGRAQVMQAEAAGIEPEAAMNPILLKPTTDVGSQVIVNGTPIGTMSARDYFAYKKQLVPAILEAYDDLASRFDVIVIEGAGSPAEINLKDEDIVNMGMARMVSAPVLLVGDIDRGGVFAQLVGTMMLLDDEERAMVKGTIVNKFRGDKTILDPGLEQLRELTDVPVAGVLPMTLLDLDDEDSLSDRFTSKRSGALVDIAVIRLPRISNFTDFMMLDALDQVGIRYVGKPSELGEPDMIVIPGTKSTLADLKWLKESGLEAAVSQCAAKGTVVFGVCGGFQMLGQEVRDPHGVEGGGTMNGMGLLPTVTVFSPDKRQVQVEGDLGTVGGPLSGLSGVQVEGYEIHMGKTEILDGARADDFETTSWGGDAGGEDATPVLHRSGNVYGSYVHGIFDSAACSTALVRALLAAKGIDDVEVQGIDMHAYKQEQYDKLADMIRNNMDMDLVYRILEEGV